MLLIEGYCLKYGDCPPIWWKAKPAAFMRGADGKTLAMRSDIPVYIGDYNRVYKDIPDGTAKVFLRRDGIWAEIRLPADLYSMEMFTAAKIGCMIKDIEWDAEHEEVEDGELFFVNIQVGENNTNIHPVQKITENRPFKEAIFWTSEYYRSLSEEEDNNGTTEETEN